jgi:hypothetical protein
VSTKEQPMATNQTDDHDDEDDDKSSHKDRSPNYPAISFTEALERAKKVHDQEQRHPVSPEIAAQHMGYKKLTGTSYPVIAALKRYGLVEKVKKDIRISDDAHFVFVHPEGHPDREEVIRRLAMMPELFNQVLAEFPGGLPSDVNLRAKLRTKWNFASDGAADSFIKSLRESVRIRDSGVAKPDANVKNTGESIKEPTVTHGVIPPMKQPAPSHESTPVARQWEIAPERFVSVALPSDPTVDDVEALEEFLAILKQELALVWKKKAKKGGDA